MSIKTVNVTLGQKNRGSTQGKDTFAPILTLPPNFNEQVKQVQKSSASEALVLALQLLEEMLDTPFLRVVQLPSGGLQSLANQLSLHSPFQARPRTLTVPLPNGLGMFVIVLLNGLEGTIPTCFGFTSGNSNREVLCIFTYASPLSAETKLWTLVDVSPIDGIRSWRMLGATQEFVCSRMKEVTSALPNNTGNALWKGYAKVSPPMCRNTLPRPSLRKKTMVVWEE